MVKRLLVFVVVGAGLLFGVSGLAAAGPAHGNHAILVWVVGADPPFTEAAMAPDGTTITLSGVGTLAAGPGNTADGGGTYSLSSGGSGTWTVTGVQGFVSYGEGIPQGLPGTFGGQAKLNVTLSNGASGVLTITCLLGTPPAGKAEGITLVLGNGGQFTKPVPESGDNVFLGP